MTRRFKLTIEMGKSTIHNFYDIAYVLTRVASVLQSLPPGVTKGDIYDENNKTVGAYRIEEYVLGGWK